MRLNIDLHNHSINSMDGEFTVHEMVSAAAGKHVDVFAVTDHCEVNQWEELHLSETVPASFLQIEAEKPLTSLCLLAGVELGQPLQNPERSRWVLNRFRWDFVIGSLHNTSGDPDFYFMDFAAMSDGEIHRALKKYYSELLEMAEWGNFDTLAHITYPYRYLNAARAKREIQICAEDFDEDAAAVMKKLIEKQIALELNGSSISRYILK